MGEGCAAAVVVAAEGFLRVGEGGIGGVTSPRDWKALSQ